MAICAGIPFSVVGSGIDREIGIMYREGSRFPARRGGMAIAAGGRQPDGSVVRIGGLVVVRLVTGYTGGRNIAVIAVCMTLAAVDP